MQIKNRWTQEVLFENADDNVRDTVIAAVKEKADLTGADLCGADLTRADLTGAYLRGAYLPGADLTGADLTGAYLPGADLRGADLCGADLTGADLRGATGVFSFGPIGETGRMGYAVDHGNCVMFQLGCFWGNEKEAVTAIREKYGAKSNYEAQVKLAAKIIKASRNG